MVRFATRYGVLVLLIVGLGASARAACLTFGVVPQQSALALASRWGPVLALVGERTGLDLCFETARDIPTFEKRLAQGHYDIAYINPFHYMVLQASVGYRAFAREKGARLRGLIVVPKDSPIQDLRGLEGQSVAFPAPNAFAATMLPLAQLRSLGVSVKPVFVDNHDSVYLGVARGYFPAGGGIRRTLAQVPDAVRQSLRVLWETASFTPHPLVAHPRVPGEVLARLSRGLFSLDGDAHGGEVLSRTGLAGFEAGDDADWDDVRALGLDNSQPMPPGR